MTKLTLGSLASIASLAASLGLGLMACSSESTTSSGADQGPRDSGASSTKDGGGGGGKDAVAPTPDAVAPTTDAAPATGDSGGARAFGVDCSVDSDCASNLCYHGGQGGGGGAVEAYCSLPCGADAGGATCPKPPTSGFCNQRGYCKR